MEAENNKNYTEPALSKVSHFDLDLARNAMNTTPAEDQQLDYFITEMHEDGTSLENIIKRQDGIYERSEGRYPKEEAVYKSLREKIMKHYGAPIKTYTFIKAGHVYNVPASTPAEAVQLLRSRGVKGFKTSDAFDNSTPRTAQEGSKK